MAKIIIEDPIITDQDLATELLHLVGPGQGARLPRTEAMLARTVASWYMGEPVIEALAQGQAVDQDEVLLAVGYLLGRAPVYARRSLAFLIDWVSRQNVAAGTR